MRRQLSRLCQQEEKKLAQLGRQRDEFTRRLQQNRQQHQALSQLIVDYTGQSFGGNAMLWQNASQMAQTLEPMKAKLNQQQALLQQEQLRMEGLWRKQLGRQQGLKWLQGQTLAAELERLARREQAAVDDMAGFYARTKV
ncbi:flagellar FliJ family protein [Shewanella salipaludis]|uniref:Flagellar FliJ protein n=1 Tax=Shewanella salipaludis TaxID=2723052 RepID=A0A972JL02_9GAMM|nr:flagellar FliJ family protein [Shewanella salipaludis]NMH66740.1 hypothetical protein [Shewanella salipaludis]